MRYMVAVDGKEAAKKAVGNHILVAFLRLSPINTLQDFVLKLVKPDDAVFVVFVQPEMSLLESMGDRETLTNERAKVAEELSVRYLELFQSSLAKDVHFDVHSGDAKTVIVEKVTERNCDILVVGHRDMGMIQRAVLGSVSEYLVKSAPCSVLVC